MAEARQLLEGRDELGEKFQAMPRARKTIRLTRSFESSGTFTPVRAITSTTPAKSPMTITFALNITGKVSVLILILLVIELYGKAVPRK
jgi:hypothetical protein